MACEGNIDSDSSEPNSDDDFGSEYCLDISESNCSVLLKQKVILIQKAYQWCELNSDTRNPAPRNLYFKETQD
ncbi:hypothetical protein TNCV_2206891 [Trichonephila clavipes]|uniref:Uncharacterized protein n=1 Tax=Trichonephila clavipes TaxID=2585209 RepID=A0A8X6VES4_TRICX|nr:hypothetical protein TNCV_2206891 [Trichonephila clavipes]